MSMDISTNTNLDKICKIISVKFDVILSPEQTIGLINTQPEELKVALQQETVTLTTLDQLVEAISETITGMHYPTEHSTSYYKEYFKKKLTENKASYFGLCS